MDIGGFADKDRIESGTNEIRFRTVDGKWSLVISFPLGIIDYETVNNGNSTNLIQGIPSKAEAVELTKRLLPKLGVRLSELDKNENTGEPRFHVGDEETTYYVNQKRISNVVKRGVGFRRAIDGVSFLSVGTGGDGSVE
jgi:hypothetical protein